jgi:putative resolvase
MERRLSVTQAAKRLGVTSKTLQRWDREGKLAPSGRTPTDRRWYDAELIERLARGSQSIAPGRRIAYCRVSSQAQQPDLANQRAIVDAFVVAKGLVDVEFMTEIGGGLNFNRPKFLALMEAIDRRAVSTLILAHRDRLPRVGDDWFARYAASHGCEVMVLNQERLSPEAEMVADLMTIVHGFSSRLVGLRNVRKQLGAALKQDHADRP